LGIASKQAGALWISSESITNTSLLAAHTESNYDETIDSFDDMTLKTELVRGIYSYGFERPSAVQQRVIMPVIKGERRDGGGEQAAHEALG
jgi:superfamily II DNA/RNA helicase